ncbi:MAG: hypothetical protein GC136_10675 [Alphaproteobacteria bacterium]|nr:hypothetical protein [Alphaproteobacteria bacterium]
MILYIHQKLSPWLRLCLASIFLLSACENLNFSQNSSPQDVADSGGVFDSAEFLSQNIQPSAGNIDDGPVDLAPRIGDEDEAVSSKLAPPAGLRSDKLFNYPVFDDGKRFQRLENNVQTLRDDLNKILPVINTQLALQGDVKGLVQRLNGMVGADAGGLNSIGPAAGIAPIDAEALEAQTPLTKAASTPNPPSRPKGVKQANNSSVGSPSELLGIRATDRLNNELRIVLETKDAPAFDIKLKDSTSLLVQGAHGTPANINKTAVASTNVKDLLISPDSTITLSFTEPVELVSKMTLPPGTTSKNYRTIVDLKR